MTFNEKSPLIGETTISDSASIDLSIQEKGIIPTTPGYRYFLTIMMSLGIMWNVGCRGIISVTIVAMTNTSHSEINNNSDECFPELNYLSNISSEQPYNGEFNWDSKTQGFVLSAFGYGFVLTQVPAGILASKFGGKRVFGIGIFVSGVLNLLMPVVVRAGVEYAIAIQVMIGLFLGSTMPAVQSIMGRVAPVMQRSRLFSFVYQGASLGTVVSLPLSGLLSATSFLGGWPSVYYVYGTATIVWSIPWFVFIKDTSDADVNKYCSIKVPRTPWKHLLTSKVSWSICIAHFTYGWVFFSMTSFLPTYLADVLKFNVSDSAFVSTIPFIAAWIVQSSTGTFVDYFRKRGVRTIIARKFCTFICFIFPAVLLITVYSAGCDRILIVTIISLALGFSGFCVGGFLVNHIDVASNFSGQLMGLSNTFMSISAILAPTVIGFIIEGNSSRATWHQVYIIAACVNTFGTIIYLIFGQGEEQNWNRYDEHFSVPGNMDENTKLFY